MALNSSNFTLFQQSVSRDGKNVLAKTFANDPSNSLPSVAMYDNDTGDLIRIEYRCEGVLHRDHRCGPAVIECSPTSKTIILEEFRLHGILHRDSSDGPAITLYDASTGNPIRELYVESGIYLHRNPKLGPALIEYNPETRGIRWAQYWFNGLRVEIEKPSLR